MSWMFIWAVVALVAVLILMVVLPWLRRRPEQENLTQANIAVVKERLQELQREVDEGLLSEQDMRQASDEIKISLVEEQYAESKGSANASFALACGALLAIAVGATAYYKASNIKHLNDAQAAIDALPNLSAKLAEGQGENFTPEDFQQLTLAIRKRLQENPEDGQGWMFLGRIWMALNQTEEAYAALEKALHYSPDDENVRMTYARALMMSDDKAQLENARRLLASLIDTNQQNDNLVLMQAVVAGRLGDKTLLADTLTRLEGKLPADSPIARQLSERLASLNGEPPVKKALTGFNLTVEITEEMATQLPDNAFLFVFAQDANSENRMPAAVLRLPLENLPLTIKLTSENAMAPNYSLDQLSTARLIARISADQEAPPQPGDLEGSLEALVENGKVIDQTIVINKELM
ncbi:c-type cytochrome biogenesis protein CcmI [uncultured Alteromonas sp.]|jgi:cytochrome c-type biogenesis protein CcmI|uniref:c-type cytochrome biogenesis protein CcmI n=1 Tax=uncultured Alteromonas sp. TaxID=179113 RepID=UPI0025FED279|nr:c-type cytochrome biogenesis protein CcmI [uncultured Alteromonas sp.]